MVEASHLLLLVMLIVTIGAACCSQDTHEVVSLQKLQWGEEKYSSRISSQQKSRRLKSATVLEMKHLTPFSDVTNHKPEHNLQILLSSDAARVSSLQLRIESADSPRKSAVQVPLTSGAALQTMNYVIAIKIGNKDMTVIVDTGSDLTWIQCKPCTSCYPQQNPLYDPLTSPSYHPIPCNSTSCTSLLPSTGNSGVCDGPSSTCNYALTYGDGSYTRGVLAQEDVGLAGTDVKGFVFGCGKSNRGLFGGTAGLVGLGRMPLSLPSQTKSQFGGVFSYCLPSRDSSNSSGNLILGGGADSSYRNYSPIAYTRMVPGPPLAPFYFLNLTGIRVGGSVLGFSTNGGVRVLIDSGTVITRLVPSVYGAVKGEFLKQFSGYPSAPGFSILDTCFDLSGYESVRVPKLGLGFEGGVEMSVDLSGIFYSVKKDGSQVCLAMARLSDERGVGIIGNFQQKNQRVVYDTVGSRVGFGMEDCSYL